MRTFQNAFTEKLGIEFPLIMAPMFLVSNQAMLTAGMESGVMATAPTLNFRTDQELANFLEECNTVKSSNPGSYGVNLIVHPTNGRLDAHVALCEQFKVPLVITSLGNPTEVIARVKAYGGMVLCDVTNLKHAQKAWGAGCDGFIVVGAGAGGHAGKEPLHVLAPAIKRRYPEAIVMAAGGIADGKGIAGMVASGLEGVSMGTRFIASKEAQVDEQYKESIVSSGIEDIAMTDRLSGVPCAIILTPDNREIRLEMGLFEKLVATQPWLKKWVKKNRKGPLGGWLNKEVILGQYNQVWSAGKSVEFVDDVQSCSSIITQLRVDFEQQVLAMNNAFNQKESSGK